MISSRNPVTQPYSSLWTLSAGELVAGFRNAQFTPLDAIESVLMRMDAVNPLLNAVISCDREGARRAASESTRRYREGAPLSAVDGVPMTVKDNILVSGMRSTWGSRLFADFVPEVDELPVARLREAGGIIFGKTNCPEFTLQGYTDNPLFGPTLNPWNLALTPGGSSGGAVAAVAAGMGPIGIGTDGGGSIRRPASYTGLIGLKPSRGRVPRTANFPALLLDFETVGPIARSVADVERVMEIIAPSDPGDAASGPFRDRPFYSEAIRPCRILFAPTFGDAPVDPEIATAVSNAAELLESLGHYVERGPVPFDFRSIEEAWLVITRSGLAWLSTLYRRFSDDASETMQEIALSGRKLSATDYISALTAIRRVENQLMLVFEDYDLLLTPSAAALPWKADEVFPREIAGHTVGPRGHALFTAFVNLVGAAAINLPCGWSRSGLPMGLQLVCRPGSDGLLTGIAAQCESTTLWRTTNPNEIPALNHALNLQAV